MIIIGASGHAKVVLNIAKLNNIDILGIYDDNPNIEKLNNITVFHHLSEIPKESEVIFAIGNNKIRQKISLQYSNFKTKILIHPKSVIDSNVTIGEGSVVMASVTINNSSLIGNHCIVNTASSIDHDCMIDDFVHISPGAVLCGGVKVGTGTQIGANAVILQNVKIGKWVTIGAGAVILKDIADYSVLVGNPGRFIKYNDK